MITRPLLSIILNQYDQSKHILRKKIGIVSYDNFMKDLKRIIDDSAKDYFDNESNLTTKGNQALKALVKKHSSHFSKNDESHSYAIFKALQNMVEGKVDHYKKFQISAESKIKTLGPIRCTHFISLKANPRIEAQIFAIHVT